MDRPTLVPARIYSHDPRLARRVGVLEAAQVVVALLTADVRVVPLRVAVPDVDENALERDARVAIDLRHDPVDREDRALRHGAIGRVDADVRRVEVLVDVVRALGQLRHDDARWQRAGDGSGRGTGEGS